MYLSDVFAMRRSNITFLVLVALAAIAFWPPAATADIDRFSLSPREAVQSAGPFAYSAVALPKVSHVTLVIMENHAYGQIIGSKYAPYENLLAENGALMTNSHAVSHPSEPNYLALFSGSTQGMSSDLCPVSFSAPSLGDEVLDAHGVFRAYAQNIPYAGDKICNTADKLYYRKHVPSMMFTDIAATFTVPYTQLATDMKNGFPAIAFVTPNMCDDMHNCSVSSGDKWLSQNLPQIISYDAAHNGLLILTYDESLESDPYNHIATILLGPMVKVVDSSQNINHYSVLRTIEQLYGLPYLGNSAGASPIINVWK